MDTRQFHIADFIGTDEHFHFARKSQPAKKPRFLHSHDYYEVFLVTRGATDHWVNGRTQRLETGDLVFIRPQDCHALQGVKGTDNKIINVAFRPATVEHLGERYGDELEGRFFWHSRPNPDTYHLSEPRHERAVNTSRELQTSKNTLLRAEEYILYLTCRVVDYPARVGSSTPKWLLEACGAAKRPEVFREGVAGFVRIACRGHEHVCRTMRKFMGLSPSAFINEKRMEHAAMMLASSDIPIGSIPDEIGITNTGHFYRLFQQHYGTTPRHYRLLHQKNPIRTR